MFAIFTGLQAYNAILTDIYNFCRFTLTINESFHALYLNCCEFAVTPSMLCEAKHATIAYNREHKNKLSVSQQVVFCLLLYMGVLQRDPMPELYFVMVLTSCKNFLQIVRIFCHDFTDMSCPRLTPLRYCRHLLAISLKLCEDTNTLIRPLSHIDKKKQ